MSTDIKALAGRIRARAGALDEAGEGWAPTAFNTAIKNCGTGGGGFQPGNSCARGGDGGGEEEASAGDASSDKSGWQEVNGVHIQVENGTIVGGPGPLLGRPSAEAQDFKPTKYDKLSSSAGRATSRAFEAASTRPNDYKARADLAKKAASAHRAARNAAPKHMIALHADQEAMFEHSSSELRQQQHAKEYGDKKGGKKSWAEEAFDAALNGAGE
jgi:hypothetical protein